VDPLQGKNKPYSYEEIAMSKRVYNFSAGPAIMPQEVLEASAKALVDFQGKGFGIAEVSHRGKEFDAVLIETVSRCRSIFGIPDNYDVLFLQGGATQMFATIPMNFMQGSADYVVTGEWAKKASEYAKAYGTVNVLASSESTGFDRIPTGWKTTPGANYLHICSNNTIYGTRWSTFPEHPCLIADMSSEIAARPFDVKKFALFYAGAQKNLGPAGVVLVVVRKDLYSRITKAVPSIFNFQKHAEANSCLNTPPSFAVYMLLETMRWLEKKGGLAAIEKINEQKAKLIYDEMDRAPDFYKGTVTDIPNRSRMNITFRLPNEDLTTKFLKEAEKKNMMALKGYRTVGGVRASIYNAMPIEGCETLARHMREFHQANAGK
jgi:phosphoserine aminotransferase